MRAFAEWIDRKIKWSFETFGPGERTKGVVAHIRKELEEVEENPKDLGEWCDVILLAIDGAGRQGYTGKEIIVELLHKDAKNIMRDWPDWRLSSPDRPIEHVTPRKAGALGEPDKPYHGLIPPAPGLGAALAEIADHSPHEVSCAGCGALPGRGHASNCSEVKKANGLTRKDK